MPGSAPVARHRFVPFVLSLEDEPAGGDRPHILKRRARPDCELACELRE